MSEQTEVIADLEELLDAEIPCDGWGSAFTTTRHDCDRPADLRASGHGCFSGYAYKCISCWQQWYEAMVKSAGIRGGYNQCADCHCRFYTVQSFSDYRPF